MSSYESIDVPKFCLVFPLKSKGMTSRWPFPYFCVRRNFASVKCSVKNYISCSRTPIHAKLPEPNLPILLPEPF